MTERRTVSRSDQLSSQNSCDPHRLSQQFDKLRFNSSEMSRVYIKEAISLEAGRVHLMIRRQKTALWPVDAEKKQSYVESRSC